MLTEKEKKSLQKTISKNSFANNVKILHEMGKTTAEIHVLLERSKSTINSQKLRQGLKNPDALTNAQRVYQGSSKPKSDAPLTDRTCLKCQERFMADGLYNRICIKCTSVHRSKGWL
mgnify:CR=1 FL=1|jgi:hypothetical protein|tara:strand:- start:2835 stop:3185 length:351 start_codon:yes stop_codon:yes gene_type:complete